MRFLLIIGLLLLAVPAAAQERVIPQQYVFTVTPDEGQVIINALLDLPAKTVLDLVNKMHQQATDQQAAAAKAGKK